MLVVALILLGPKRLPEIARSVAKGLKEVRKAGADLRETWESEVEQTAGPELRALRNLRNPGSLVDAAWDAPAKSAEQTLEGEAKPVPPDADPVSDEKPKTTDDPSPETPAGASEGEDTSR